VGAPEALLVGVVALVLFGPKGLAQAAKSLGSTLRAFAPTIRELTQVSTELKSTLEEEIGLNDLKEELRRPATPSPRAPANDSFSSKDQNDFETNQLSRGRADREKDLAMDVDPDIESKRAESAKAAWGGQAPTFAGQQTGQSLTALTTDELEAELARRRKMSEDTQQDSRK
jgi:TatA/E family protein of Tat protein translocase